ncbi:GNAT family N-acetyltransferase [Candidatus Kaiserbacteria bacterium]|nr:GNAT family N-acetyltransferase [Candidatus Kaiserbacteria bacterium]
MNEELHIRPAHIEDARLLFEWRNDEATRRASVTTAPLIWEEHLEWLSKVLNGEFPGRSIYIVEIEGEPAGTVRSDERQDGFTEISYAVSPQWRGKGLGKRMVIVFVAQYLRGKKLAARIKKGVNPASEAIAHSLGLAPFAEIPSGESNEPPTVEWR